MSSARGFVAARRLFREIVAETANRIGARPAMVGSFVLATTRGRVTEPVTGADLVHASRMKTSRRTLLLAATSLATLCHAGASAWDHMLQRFPGRIGAGLRSLQHHLRSEGVEIGVFNRTVKATSLVVVEGG